MIAEFVIIITSDNTVVKMIGDPKNKRYASYILFSRSYSPLYILKNDTTICEHISIRPRDKEITSIT